MDTVQREEFLKGVWGTEKAFMLLGMDTGMLMLRKYVADYMLENDPAVLKFLEKMKKYDKSRLNGTPASPQNQPKDLPGVNYFAPERILTDTCQSKVFKDIRADKRFDNDWFQQFVTDLMASEYRNDIAKQWSLPKQCLIIKGNVLGILLNAGVFKGSRLNMARLYYAAEKNSAEVKTLAKYMNDLKHCPYVEWVEEYVKKFREAQVENSSQ